MDQNNAAQAAEQAIKAAIRKAYDDGYNDAKMAPDNCSTYCVERAVRLDSAALLSKLRAPVSSIREAFELTYAADADDPACAADLFHFTNGWRACVMSQVRAPVADERAAFKKCHSAIIKSIASIARADGPDTRKEDDPELLYRSPVMDEVVRIRVALDECSAALASAPVAGEAQIVAWYVDDKGLGRRYTTFNPATAQRLKDMGETVRPLVYGDAAPQASAEAELQRALGDCRDAFPAPAAGSELELLWAEAMSDPLAVPAYVKACAAAPQASETTERIEQMAGDRYRVESCGRFSHKVVAGDGSRSLYTGTKDNCLRVAAELTGAFLDGAFVAAKVAPQAREEVRDAALEEAATAVEARIGVGEPGIDTQELDRETQECANAIRALKTQADKDGGQQLRWRVTDDMRYAVRFAPSSAHWSERLKEFFGPDAREGIDALERQLREARAMLDSQQRAGDAYQIGDLVMGHAEGMRVSSPLKTSHGFGTDIEHRFEISDGVDRFGVVIILTKLKSLTAALSATQAGQGERDA